jgi:hypothetical protein
VVVITVKFGNLALLDLVDKSRAACVVNFVILQLQFLQSTALLHQLSNHLGTDGGHLVVSDDQRLQLLLLLVAEGLNDDFDTLITDVVASKVQNSHSLAVSQSSLKLFNSTKTNIVTLEAQNLEVLFILEGLAECSSTIREDTIVGEPNFLDVFGGLENLGNVSSAIRSNHIVGEVEFSKSCVVLDCFANGNAAVNTCLVVSHIEHEQILLILQNASNIQGSFLAQLTVS